MGLGGGVHHGVDASDEPSHDDGVPHVALDEREPGVAEVLSKVRRAASGRESVEHRDPVAALEQRVDEMRSDEAGAAGHEQVIVAHRGVPPRSREGMPGVYLRATSRAACKAFAV